MDRYQYAAADRWSFTNKALTWVGLGVIALVIALFAGSQPLVPTSTSYWPSTAYAIPWHGAIWRPVQGARPVALSREELALAGEHDQRSFYTLRGLAGGGGGMGRPSEPRIYLAEPDGRFLPLAPEEPSSPWLLP